MPFNIDETVSQIAAAHSQGNTHLTTELLRSIPGSAVPLSTNNAYTLGKCLFYALDQNYLPLARLFIAKGASPNFQAADGGKTTLHITAARNFLQLTHLLLTLGANPEAKDYRGQTPLSYAQLNGSSDTKQLLEAGLFGAQANLDENSNHNWNPQCLR